MRVLILGGTTEASRLAEALAGRTDFAALLSLAGRTAHPITPPVPSRIGGFGGADGLGAFLVSEHIAALVDATHPFAARISANAVAACTRLKLPLLAFSRAAWCPGTGDRWTLVPNIAAAVHHLDGLAPQRIFVTTGRLDLAAYKGAPRHDYLIRTINPPCSDDLPPRTTLITGRGPFAVDEEVAILREHRIALLITKNSGGTASAAKLRAARRETIPVVMIERPALPARVEVVDLDAVLAWLDAHRAHP